jgi:putative DNA primase/helicase
VAFDAGKVESIIAGADLPAIIGSYTPIQKRGSEFMARCVFHSPDNNPSLSIYHSQNGSGKWRYKCFSCGEEGDALDFIRNYEGLDFNAGMERLSGGNWKAVVEPSRAQRSPPAERVTSKPPADAGVPDMKWRDLGEPSRTWAYKDVDGAVLGYVARYDTDHGKEIRCWTWGKRGKQPEGWGCGHWAKQRPLYGLDELARRPDDWVLVVEGEKTADAARELLPSYVVISWPGGANAAHSAEWKPVAGRKVLLWPDADTPGIECMDKLAALLADPKGLACHVRIVDPLKTSDNPTDEIPPGWDLANAQVEGWSTQMVKDWAKPRARPYSPNPAPPQAAVPPPTALPPPRTAADAGPPKDDTPPLTAYGDEPAAQTKRKRRPRLAAVAGNAVPERDAEAAPEPTSMSEDALADHLAVEHGKDWRFVAHWGKWFKWCGDVWQEDKTYEIFDISRAVCRSSLYWPEAASLTPDGKRKIARKATAGSVRDMAGTDRRIAATVEQWDTNPFLLGVPGGVVDLTTGELLPGEPGQYITKKCSVAPDKGEHPLFDKVLARATRDDPDIRAYLLRWFGYMLTGDVREECFLFLHGPGGSGKGTLVKCFADILGDYSATISMEAMTETKTQRHPQELAKLASARFVYASETEEGRRWNEALVKWLTGRDKITAHFMRENDFEFYPKFKLLIYGNHIPHLKSVGEEMRRRVHLIEYAGSLSDEERDTTLKDRLVEEYPAILHTMIRGCIEWLDAGLGKPESVSDATNHYLQSEDTLGMWFEDNINRDPTARALSGDVYRDFKRWADSAGEYVMSQKRFVQAMRQRGFDNMRSGGKRYLEGLTLKTPPAYGPQPGRYPDD